MTELAKRLCFDLSDALSSDPELAADFLEGTEPAVFKTEAQYDDLPLPFGQLAQSIANLRFEKLVRR